MCVCVCADVYVCVRACVRVCVCVCVCYFFVAFSALSGLVLAWPRCSFCFCGSSALASFLPSSLLLSVCLCNPSAFSFPGRPPAFWLWMSGRRTLRRSAVSCFVCGSSAAYGGHPLFLSLRLSVSAVCLVCNGLSSVQPFSYAVSAWMVGLRGLSGVQWLV